MYRAPGAKALADVSPEAADFVDPLTPGTVLVGVGMLCDGVTETDGDGTVELDAALRTSASAGDAGETDEPSPCATGLGVELRLGMALGVTDGESPGVFVPLGEAVTHGLFVGVAVDIFPGIVGEVVELFELFIEDDTAGTLDEEFELLGLTVGIGELVWDPLSEIQGLVDEAAATPG